MQEYMRICFHTAYVWISRGSRYLFGLLLLCACTATAQSLNVRQRIFEGRPYLVAQDFVFVGKTTTYFALDMETAKLLPDTLLARQLFEGSKGAEIPWAGFMARKGGETSEKRKLVYVRDRQPGTLYYRDIRAFDKILDRDEGWLRKKKKEDAKVLFDRKSYDPSSLIGFHESTQRYFLFSTYGVYAIHQDSLDGPAATLIEYPGFMMLGVRSGLSFNPDHIILEFDTPPSKGRLPQQFFKTLELATGRFSDVPGLDALVNPKYLGSTTSPYVAFYGFGTDTKDMHQRTLLYNLATRKMEQNLRFAMPFTAYKSTLYLHGNMLYEHYVANGPYEKMSLTGYCLKDNVPVRFNYIKK